MEGDASALASAETSLDLISRSQESEASERAIPRGIDPSSRPMTAALACVIASLAQEQDLSRKATGRLLAKDLWFAEAARRQIDDFENYQMDNGGVPASEEWRRIPTDACSHSPHRWTRAST